MKNSNLLACAAVSILIYSGSAAAQYDTRAGGQQVLIPQQGPSTPSDAELIASIRKHVALAKSTISTANTLTESYARSIEKAQNLVAMCAATDLKTLTLKDFRLAHARSCTDSLQSLESISRKIAAEIDGLPSELRDMEKIVKDGTDSAAMLAARAVADKQMDATLDVLDKLERQRAAIRAAQ